MKNVTGRLVLCPTPLGNLEDITLRTLRELRECDVIFAEDTRVSQKLLSHFDIHKPLRSFHERVESQRMRELKGWLERGQTVAVVSDAGMPGISDPGAELVRAAREMGARIDVLPGPNAALGALVLSGFDIHKFRFDGFAPRKPTQRRAYLESLDSVEIAAVVYEAPSRILDLLRDVSRKLPRRRIFVAREYTKMFEQQIGGTAQHVMEQIARPPRGEFVVVIEGAAAHAERAAPTIPDTVRDAIAAMIAQGMGVRATVDGMRLATGLPRNALYKVAQRVKQQATRGRR